MNNYYCSYDLTELIPISKRMRAMLRLRREDSEKITTFASLEIKNKDIISNIDIYSEFIKYAVMDQINLMVEDPECDVKNGGSNLVCCIIYCKNDEWFIELTDYESISSRRSDIISDDGVMDNEIKTSMLGTYDNLLENFKFTQAKITSITGGNNYADSLEGYYKTIESLCCELL